MFKKDWKKSLKKLSSLKEVDTSKMEITPYQDWRILVGIFFVGLIVSFGFNIYMSMEINSDNFFTTTPKNETGVVLNKDGLAKILAELEGKKAVFEKQKAEGEPTVDPSL